MASVDLKLDKKFSSTSTIKNNLTSYPFDAYRDSIILMSMIKFQSIKEFCIQFEVLGDGWKVVKVDNNKEKVWWPINEFSIEY